MVQYAQISDLYSRFDNRFVNQLSGDDNSGNPVNANINIALQDASSEILMAVLQGEMYSKLDIDALYARNDNGLIKLTCSLAIKNLIERRAEGIPTDLQRSIDFAENLLENLRIGKAVFYTEDINDNLTSAVPATVFQNCNKNKRSGLHCNPFFDCGCGPSTTSNNFPNNNGGCGCI